VVEVTKIDVLFADNRLDSGAVSRALHAVLYSQLQLYRLREAVKLVELVLRLQDVRRIASAYSSPDPSQLTAVQVSKLMCSEHVNRQLDHLMKSFLHLTCHT
jgi:hypothetical protein